MNYMIDAIEKNLLRGVHLLNCITDKEYSDISVAPYYSSIGGHMRHILDVFECIIVGMSSKKINLIARKRNEMAENHTEVGIQYFKRICDDLRDLESVDFDQIVEVTDDLGLGVVKANYTISAVLIQAHSHAIHHFASIGYIISQLGISLPDADFGFNPTTPRISEIS